MLSASTPFWSWQEYPHFCWIFPVSAGFSILCGLSSTSPKTPCGYVCASTRRCCGGMLPCLSACSSSPSRLQIFSDLASSFVVIYRFPAGEFPDPCFHLCLGFSVDSQSNPFPSFVEAIAKRFNLPSISLGILSHRREGDARRAVIKHLRNGTGVSYIMYNNSVARCFHLCYSDCSVTRWKIYAGGEIR